MLCSFNSLYNTFDSINHSTPIVSADFQFIFVACYGGTVYKIQLRTGKVENTFKCESDVKGSFCLFQAGKYLCFGSHDFYFYVLGTNSMKMCFRYKMTKPIISTPIADGQRCFKLHLMKL